MSDELLTCPFDPVHRIVRHRMPYHIIKCKKNYNGPPLDACAFNAMHLVPKDQMKAHLDKCPDYHCYRREDYEKQYEKQKSRVGSETGSYKSYNN